VNPTVFAIGDIVELQVSFKAVPVGARTRALVVLRSVNLLDNQFSEVSGRIIDKYNPT
jgi:hypothetical protein